MVGVFYPLPLPLPYRAGGKHKGPLLFHNRNITLVLPWSATNMCITILNIQLYKRLGYLCWSTPGTGRASLACPALGPHRTFPRGLLGGWRGRERERERAGLVVNYTYPYLRVHPHTHISQGCYQLA